MRALFDLLLLKCGATEGSGPSARLGWAGFQFALGARWNAPLVKRLHDLLDREGRGSLSRADFTLGLLPLYSPRVAPEEKAAFLFDCFDLDGDGEVSRDELTILLSFLAASGLAALSEAQVGHVLDNTFLQMRRGGSGNITRADFEAHFAARPAARRALLASASFDVAQLTSQVWMSLGPQWLAWWPRPSDDAPTGRAAAAAGSEGPVPTTVLGPGWRARAAKSSIWTRVGRASSHVEGLPRTR